ncbi:hypothetical protein CBS101457_003944 [Exobasidium rhododendri]|nr:hypothetical protein CBS101457_003944 [Exobasidium rhododendri]
MAELFDSYASDYTQLTESITTKLNTDVASQAGETRKSTLRRVEMEVEEAEEIVSQMEIEINSFPNSLKSAYSVKLRGYKADLDRLSAQLRKSMQQSSNANRFASTSDSNGFNEDLESGDSYDTQAQRQRLLQGTATLDDGSRRLEDSHRIALETEDLGADILRDLRGQREQIENSRDTLRQADGNIDRSSKTLQQMIRRAKQQKLITFGIIAVLVLLILLILYSKFS